MAGGQHFSFSASESLNKALQAARELAVNNQAGEVGTEHILYGLAVADGSMSAKLLKEAGVDPEDLAENRAATAFVGFSNKIDYSPRAKNLFITAKEIAQKSNLDYISTEHVLLAILYGKEGMAYQYLAETSDVEKLTQKAAAAVNMGDREAYPAQGAPPSVKMKPGAGGTLPGILKDVGIDLTQRAREHKIDPIIGRSSEIERIIQILCRKTKNNPVLIGEPGVGKSAVVEGLAQAIVDKNVPELLLDKIIFTLDIGSLMAGTKYRGQLEEKLKEVIETVVRARNIILFIDELHTLASAGHDKGEVSPADMLKPYLARGELQTVGATTTDEYRKFIEADKALERRFQPIMVDPPSIEQTIEILRGIRDNYEAFHSVKITDEAIDAAVRLSDRYIMDRFLPDKAIDLVDEAASKLKVSANTAPLDLKGREAELKKLDNERKDALRVEDYTRAAQVRDRVKELKDETEELKRKWETSRKSAKMAIDAEDVAAVVSKWTHIPVTKINETEKERLLKLEEILKKRVIGQDEAIDSVARAMRRARAGLKDPKRPIGCFIFLGPTGVGKTELTKALAEAMFDDENLIIRMDMSEYMEGHSVSKMIGSPPGYVGFDDGGQLTEQVRRKPYSVVLFDEIEKAHPDVFNLLLQIMDEGRLTDSRGRTVNFKNTIVIMTSNVGVSELKNTRKLGFGTGDGNAAADALAHTRDTLTAAMRAKFKPEFLNRVDMTVIFGPLGKDSIKKITRLMLSRLSGVLIEKGITLEFSDDALSLAAEKGYDEEYGARPLRRVIEQKIEDPLAEKMLAGAFDSGAKILCDAKDGEFVFKTARKPKTGDPR